MKLHEIEVLELTSEEESLEAWDAYKAFEEAMEASEETRRYEASEEYLRGR